MRITTLPGVFQPHSDSRMLAGLLREQRLPPHASVLDLCTGSGILAVAAALTGAERVTAVDVSRRAVATASMNARLNGRRVSVRRGSLFDAVPGERFDAIVSNPPYVPGESDDLPRRGRRRAWDAGRDGRALLDRICAQAPAHLRPGGLVLLVHSSVCGVAATADALRAGGLETEVIARRRGPLGPILRERADSLRTRGMLESGLLEEEIVVVRGRKSVEPGTASSQAGPGPQSRSRSRSSMRRILPVSVLGRSSTNSTTRG